MQNYNTLQSGEIFFGRTLTSQVKAVWRKRQDGTAEMLNRNGGVQFLCGSRTLSDDFNEVKPIPASEIASCYGW